jgi:hypothetical protein
MRGDRSLSGYLPAGAFRLSLWEQRDLSIVTGKKDQFPLMLENGSILKSKYWQAVRPFWKLIDLRS